MYVKNTQKVEQINFLASSKYQNFTYQVNDPGVAEEVSLQITAVVTTAGSVIVVLDGVSKEVAVALNDTAVQVADKIRNTAFLGWTTGGVSGTDTVTFLSDSAGPKHDAHYSANGTGSTGTLAITTQGSDNISPNADGKRIVSAGSIYPSNDGAAVGILFHDVDVTNGPQPAAVLVEGYVLEARLPVAPATAAKTAMKEIKFR
jgi:hypothetical protein